MMTRKELDRLYEALWRGNEEAFIFLLEYFMPFSKYGFTLVNILREFGRWLPPFVYRSRFVELRVIQDLEQYYGLGSVLFEYGRIRKNKEGPKGCKKSIITDIKRNKWLHYFLSDTPIQDTQFYPALLPVEVAFRAKLEKDKNLKALALRDDGFEPAYAVAFEAFCWEYYGERFFRLFRPENQAERDMLAQYAYEYYRLRYSAEILKEWEKWEKEYGEIAPWKICL
jgi:hypothetical protein